MFSESSLKVLWSSGTAFDYSIGLSPHSLLVPLPLVTGLLVLAGCCFVSLTIAPAKGWNTAGLGLSYSAAIQNRTTGKGPPAQHHRLVMWDNEASGTRDNPRPKTPLPISFIRCSILLSLLLPERWGFQVTKIVERRILEELRKMRSFNYWVSSSCWSTASALFMLILLTILNLSVFPK